ncbi:MAG: porin [Rhizobacter sp.]
MKRSLLIAALSTVAAAGSAMAQSSVTVYGRLNDSLEHQKVGDTSDNKVQDSASRIGFKGSEDLGGGLKANFVIESGFATDTGAANTGTPTSRFWNRESTVGLSSSMLGAIRLGNMPASEAYFATADYVSMHNHDTGTSEDALYRGVAVGRLQNAIAYTTPTVGGLRGDLQYSLGEGAAGFDHHRSFAVNFDQGALHLGVGYEATSADQKSLGLRALYELGAFTFGGYVERDSGTAFKRTNIRLSGMYAMGASEFHLNVGKAGKTDDVDNTGARQVTVAYNYNLSKRTKVYAFYTEIKNDSAASYNSEFTGVTTGAKLSSIALGLRHNF